VGRNPPTFVGRSRLRTAKAEAYPPCLLRRSSRFGCEGRAPRLRRVPTSHSSTVFTRGFLRRRVKRSCNVPTFWNSERAPREWIFLDEFRHRLGQLLGPPKLIRSRARRAGAGCRATRIRRPVARGFPRRLRKRRRPGQLLESETDRGGKES